MGCGGERRNPYQNGCLDPSLAPLASLTCLRPARRVASVAWCGFLDRLPPSTWSRQSLLEAASRNAAPTSATRGSRSCGSSVGGWPCTAPCSAQIQWPPASSRYLGV